MLRLFNNTAGSFGLANQRDNDALIIKLLYYISIKEKYHEMSYLWKRI